jgi:radical SAM superfamily enzyme YgiQ (UPF0313 family)
LLRAVSSLVEHIYFGSFPSEVRPDSVVAAPEMLDLVTAFCSNDNIIIGAQTGSQRLLDKIHRGHTVEDIRRATRLTLEAGLEPRLDFIFGLPGETARDHQRKTRLLIEEMAGLGAKIHTHWFMPLPGTPLAGKGPGAMDRATRQVVSRLTGKGAAYGQWQRQMQIAREIVRKAKAETEA